MFMETEVPEKFYKKEQSYIINVNNCRIANGNPKEELDIENTKNALYKFQGDLPTLPIPDLEETCQIYLKSVKPLCKNDNEYKVIE
jgi:hypothetical protein